MNKHTKKIQRIREAVWELEAHLEKFKVCVAGDLRDETDVRLGKEMYPLAQELNTAVVELAMEDK